MELLLIDGGDMFEGTYEQLADCFGITIDTVDRWCDDNGYVLTVIETKIRHLYMNGQRAGFTNDIHVNGKPYTSAVGVPVLNMVFNRIAATFRTIT